MTNKLVYVVSLCGAFALAGAALAEGLTDGIEISGRSQAVFWGTPEKPKPGRPKNLSEAQLAEVSRGIVLNASEPVKFTHWQWGDCLLRFDIKGAARVKLMGLVDVVGGAKASDWTTYEVQFRAPRWDGGQPVSPALLVVNGKPVKVGPLAAPAPEQVNEDGEQFGPLRLEAAEGGEAEIRNLWVGPLVPARNTVNIPWREMFDADSLDGWSVNGGDAPYRRENGEIVGTTKAGSPNSFLISDRDYGNFEFSVEVYGDVAFNAGLQFRSNGKGGRGRRNRTFGYQCEIDPSERAWTAGIYDEARRGWLMSLPYLPKLRTPIKKGQWNEFRILADGSVIKTWLNGKLIGHIYDAMTRRGYFGLQVHGTKNPEPHEIRWRNVRIRELD